MVNINKAKSSSLVQYSVVDAFTDQALCSGNPALVCFMDREEQKSDAWLQAVTTEFSIPAACFVTRVDIPDEHHNTADVNGVPRFSLRWFTPASEVPICGHATLAASHALFTSPELSNSDMIEFTTLSGILTAKKVVENGSTETKKYGSSPGFLIELDFPTIPFKDYSYYADQIATISKAMNLASVIDMKRTEKDDLFLVVLESAKVVENFEPQFDEIKKLQARGVIITGIAPKDSEFDFYSRFFFPKLGINEDQVCGSAHCSLVLYWSERLGKNDFVANVASRRGGAVNLRFDKKKQRVLLRGKAATVAKGCLLV